MKREFIPFEEILDETFGRPGPAEREQFDLSIELWMVGETIKDLRKKKNLTQGALGELVGVKGAQISKIERGQNMTLDTIIKVMKALDVNAKLQISSSGLNLAH